MREIKFQAFVIKHKLSNLGSNMHCAGIDSYEEIIDVHDISFDNGKIDYVSDKDGDEYSFADKSLKAVRQYTGFKDKNGREIYEGDIWVIGDKKVKVEFDQDRAGFFPFATSDGCGCCDDETYDPKNGEVIGNIYENPELLTEK